jgi:hypothetical protein
MFKQNALAAATSSNDGDCLSGADLEVYTAQNFLVPDLFRQGTHGDHRRGISLNQRRFNGFIVRSRHFNHCNLKPSAPNALGVNDVYHP